MVDFNPLIAGILPRVLTQLNRDLGSAHFGSFDRNWWHYKIRDFSSIILQQGGYFLEMAAGLPQFSSDSEQLRGYAAASVYFWAARANRRGAFEEYYPSEDGYPPLAFSTLAAGKIVLLRNLNNASLRTALKKAARKLQHRFEHQAANQQIAGLAALAVLKKIDTSLVDDGVFERLTVQTLELQASEGWFTEYDGPDLGYLSVSLDCLWDLYDFTGDQRFKESAGRAFGFLANLVIHNNGPIGMHNARNTDYLVPYGISRFLKDGGDEHKQLARQVMEILFAGNNLPAHFFQAIDDRYWSHYIGHSVVRAQLILENTASPVPAEQPEYDGASFFPECGYSLSVANGHRIMVSCMKGGLLTIRKGEHYFNDFGWIITDHHKQFVTHWWSLTAHSAGEPDNLIINAHPVPFRENTSTPFKHLVLRFISLLSGHKIISLLKDMLIFRDADPRFTFTRRIQTTGNSLIIKDVITGLKGTEEVVRAPRFSKRHVASADSFHREDIRMIKGYVSKTETNRKELQFEAVTVVNLEE